MPTDTEIRAWLAAHDLANTRGGGFEKWAAAEIRLAEARRLLAELQTFITNLLTGCELDEEYLRAIRAFLVADAALAQIEGTP